MSESEEELLTSSEDEDEEVFSEEEEQKDEDDLLSPVVSDEESDIELLEKEMEEAEKRQMKDIENEENNQSDKSQKKAPSKKTSTSPTWNGEKLFPPARKAVKPSRAWQFGGFKKNSAGFLLTDKTICGICGKEQRYFSTASSLQNHLMAEHTGLWAGDEENNVKETTQIGDYFKSKTKVIKYPSNHPKQKKLVQTLTEWVVKNKRPLRIVEDPKLVESFEVADERLKVPSRKKMKIEIEKMYKHKKAELIEELKEVEWGTETNDAGSSSGARSFIDVNFHWVTKDFYPKKKILKVMEMKESKDASNYRRKTDEAEDEFGVKEKVFNTTTDNEATMRKAYNDEERNGCYAHIASKSHKKALENQETLKKVRLKLRKISKKANKSSKFKIAMARKQKESGLKIKTLKQEVKTRFTSTHTCFKSFLNDPNENTDAPMDDVKVTANIKAINDAMKAAKFKKKELNKLEITAEDVKKVKEVLKVLEPIEEDITLLGGEKFATGSTVLPVLKKLRKRLASDEDDLIYIAKLKRDILEDMQQRCTENLNMPVLAKATFFDKRFDIEKVLDNETRDKILNEIEEELVKLESNTEAKKKSLKTSEESSKKKRFLGKGLSDSEDEDTNEGAAAEYRRYRLERKIKSDSCPFGWWRNRGIEYPFLSRLARKYLAVQATSTSAERVMSTLGLTLEKKRQAMRGELFDQLMFLSDA